jgi:hypothetical protein
MLGESATATKGNDDRPARQRSKQEHIVTLKQLYDEVTWLAECRWDSMEDAGDVVGHGVWRGSCIMHGKDDDGKYEYEMV